MISVKPQERLATFPTVKNPNNLFSSEPFRKCLAKIYPFAWEKSQNFFFKGTSKNRPFP